MGKVLTVREVAEFLHISPVTVYLKVRKEEIPAIRVGRNWRFPLDLLEEWISKKAKKDKGAWKYHKTAAYQALREAEERKGQVMPHKEVKAEEMVAKLFKSYECGGVKGSLSRKELYSER